MNRDDNLTTLLRAHFQNQANPDRVGCPTLSSLEAFLYGQIERRIADEIGEHLPYCRECRLELKTLREMTWEEIPETEPQLVGVG